MRAAAGKIENETFNTLKSQGYELEHNFGHGHQQHLATVLMLLAFLIDQLQELYFPLFQSRTSEGRTPVRAVGRVALAPDHRATVAFHYTRFRYFLNPHWDRLPGNSIRTDG